MTKKDLYTRLYNAGTGEWVRRGDRDEMLRVAALCIEALDELQKRELELAPGGSQTQPNIAVLESGTETASQVEPKGEPPLTESELASVSCSVEWETCSCTLCRARREILRLRGQQLNRRGE